MRIDPAKKQKEATYQVVLDILKLSPCYNAFLITTDLDNKKFEIGVELFHEILSICPRVLDKEFMALPPHDALVSFLKQLGYKGSMELLSNLLRPSRAQILWGFFYKKNFDYAELIWEYIEYRIDNRQTGVKRSESMPYPRFTKVIIHYFLSKCKSIPKRHNSFINTIKDDDVLGKLKCLSDIPCLSTDTKPLKKIRGKGKGLMCKKATITPSKKGSITAEDNIIPEPDVALKLGVSISLTEAEEQNEQRRVYESHKCLVTEKIASDEESDEE
ncbi:hypothetical protein Tco_1088736 [Tanacetum coccineum]